MENRGLDLLSARSEVEATLTLDGPNIRTIDPTTRNFFFGIGGIILVGADQPEGVYQATFDVTATYL